MTKTVRILIASAALVLAAGTMWVVNANEAQEHAKKTECADHHDTAAKCPHHAEQEAKPDCCKTPEKPCPHKTHGQEPETEHSEAAH